MSRAQVPQWINRALVKVFKGQRLVAASATCNVLRTRTGVRLMFCQDNMTVDLPWIVVEQIRRVPME